MQGNNGVKKMNVDFIVIGGGITGLNAAVRLSSYGKVLLAVKGSLDQCNTVWAQGGIAASMGDDDCPQLHLQDTLIAGDGLCNPKAVEIMVAEAPERICELIDMGVSFDRKGSQLALGREGAHCRNRVLHAGGDRTGKVIWQALASIAYQRENLIIWENVLAVDLIMMEQVCAGVSFSDWKTGRIQRVGSRAVLLATGGAGRLYPVTSNPPTATGDGVAMAYRVGAELQDLEFIQFHPTVLTGVSGAGFLISEAVRGEGGILRNHLGEHFMPRYHSQEDLAPRDVVARAMYREMVQAGAEFVFLDVRHFSPGFFAQRFPQIYDHLSENQINPETDMIPVAPAAHYLMGGVKTNLWGATNLSGLYAAGETACTGVHGANRLASNSLLEGLVFSTRAVQAMSTTPLLKIESLPKGEVDGGISPTFDEAAKKIMLGHVGIFRDQEKLQQAVDFFSQYQDFSIGIDLTPQKVEELNMGQVAYLSSLAAFNRKESRGSHFRTDFPDKSGSEKHIVLRKGEDGITKWYWTD